MVFNAPIVLRNRKEKGLKMQSAKAESPRIVHYDAIHRTNLLNGVKVNVGKAAEDGWEVIHTKNEDRYHVRTICRRIADEFFMHKGEEDYVPCDFQMRHILSIELDRDFKTHALYEFSEKSVVEQLPPLFAPKSELVGSLTDRLIEAFESSGMAEFAHCSLDLAKMREIRDQVFSGEKRGEEQKSRTPTRTIHPIARDRALQAGRRHEDDSGRCCSPTVIAGAGMLSGFFVLVALFSKMFSDEEKGQRVTRVDKLGLNTQMNSRGTIY